MHAITMRTCLASFLAASFLSLSAVAAHAQAPGAITASVPDDDGPQTAITTNPVWDIFGGFNLGIEHALSKRFSIEVDGLHLGATGTSSDGATANISVNEVTLQPHIYFGAHALSGFYVAPFVQLLDVKADSSDGGFATGAGAALGSTIGWAWVGDHMDVKLGIGAEVVSAAAEGHGPDQTPKSESAGGAGLTMDLSMGVAF
jgi:hypothetical protein